MCSALASVRPHDEKNSKLRSGDRAMELPAVIWGGRTGRKSDARRETAGRVSREVGRVVIGMC